MDPKSGPSALNEDALGPPPGTSTVPQSGHEQLDLEDIWSGDELRHQTVRFRRFLKWLVVPFFFFGPYDLVLFLVFRDVASGLLALIIFGLIPALLYARRLLDRGRLEQSVFVTVLSLLVPATLIVFVRPYLYPVLVTGCLLAVAVALPFVARRTLRRLVYAGIANSALIIAVGTTIPPLAGMAVPPEVQTATVGAAMFAVTALVFLMIWLFSSRLTASLATTKRSRKTLARANEQLRDLDRAKTQFMNMTAHEFSTPLTPILIQLHLLRNSGSENLTEEQRSSLQMVERNFSRLSQLAADLLDMTRVQAGKLRLAPSPVRLASVIADSVRAQQGVADAAGIRLSAQLDDTVDASVDVRRIAQVMDNLIGNALKFTPVGGTIHVELRRQGEEALLTVQDSGTGLSTEDLQKLFQAFSQIEGHHNGTGLGLFISKGIVEAHGGRIWAQSAGRGHGSTFGVSLPLSARPRPDPAASRPLLRAPRRA